MIDVLMYQKQSVSGQIGAVRKPHLPGLRFKPELPNLFFNLHKPLKQGNQWESLRELVKVGLYRVHVNKT